MTPALSLDDRDWTHPGLEAFRQAALLMRLPFDEAVRQLPAGQVYLATPYSKRAIDERGCWSIYHSVGALSEAARWAGRFARAGVSAVSPIMISAQIVHDAYAGERCPPGDFPALDAARWQVWCRPILASSRAVVVPMIDGWNQSDGIWREVLIALHALRPVYLVEAA